MAKEEVNPVAGVAAMIAIFAIMIILLAVLALVVVNALRDSPWGLFTITATIPIALLMGGWMNNIRPARSSKPPPSASSCCSCADRRAVRVAQHPVWGAAFTWSAPQLSWAVMILRLHRVRAAGVAAAGAADYLSRS
jgi:carbon starvation protein